MSEGDPRVWTQADREEAHGHYRALALLLLRKRCWGGKASGWRIQVDDCVFKFSVTAYPRHGTPIWEEREREREAAQAEFEREYPIDG